MFSEKPKAMVSMEALERLAQLIGTETINRILLSTELEEVKAQLEQLLTKEKTEE